VGDESYHGVGHFVILFLIVRGGRFVAAALLALLEVGCVGIGARSDDGGRQFCLQFA
jgi:hypothetical protein